MYFLSPLMRMYSVQVCVCVLCVWEGELYVHVYVCKCECVYWREMCRHFWRGHALPLASRVDVFLAGVCVRGRGGRM